MARLRLLYAVVNFFLIILRRILGYLTIYATTPKTLGMSKIRQRPLPLD
jgi:hypothetical protein